MKLDEKIAQYASSNPFYTFEFFPPRTDHGFDNLVARIGRLAELNPLAVSITWGAGGSTKNRSLELAGLAQQEFGIDTVMHLTCTNMVQGMVDDALRAAKARGIKNILALRGDPPRGEEYWIASDSRFAHGIDLVTYIRSNPEFSNDFCIGVAAYPDGHPDHKVDPERELDSLKAKVDAGADFIVTQLFYDADKFLIWIKTVRDKGITVPIIPGIMPIQTYSSFQRLIKLCGSCVPESVMAELEPIKHDDQKVKDFGVTLAVSMIQKLTASGAVKGVHFCTLNLEKSVQRVLENLRWVGQHLHHAQNKLIADTPGAVVHATGPDTEFVVTPEHATTDAAQGMNAIPQAEQEAGRGELNTPESWDDFPNGRFGDFKSPAFGSQDPWGGFGISRHEALAQWGHPRTLDDLTQLFLRHLNGQIATTPFSPDELSPESQLILPHLARLTQRGWWTVGSQPAADGVRSDDAVLGWGPRGGYVFQKGFVEFFCEASDVERIERKVAQEGKGWVNYFAGNVNGECRTNMPDEGRNAVTWGVFPGQEIAQSTIIERESFLSWKDEAFSIWSDWASCYHPDSPERALLDRVRCGRWLLSIVHHDYKDSDALWTFLFNGIAVL